MWRAKDCACAWWSTSGRSMAATVELDDSQTLTCPAPGKLNLFLLITGRRADGYHTLQTLFRFIDFGDTLSFRLRRDGEIVRRDPIAGVPAESDLTVRAALLLKRESGCELGAEISI